MSSSKANDLAPAVEPAGLKALAPGRRERVLADIQAALLNTRLTLVEDRTTGFDPYDSRGGKTRREVWKPGRR